MCDFKFKDIKNKKRINIEIRYDGLIKKRIEMILAQKKNFRFIEIDELIFKMLGWFLGYYYKILYEFKNNIYK